jgi:hypothetical protein
MGYTLSIQEDRDLYKTNFPKPWQKSHVLVEEKKYYTFEGVLKEEGYRFRKENAAMNLFLKRRLHFYT